MPLALRVESVSKCFRIGRNQYSTIKDAVIRCLTGRREPGSNIWALRDVSFSLEQGRSLGVIGHNGAGKSTLLRLLCGLGRPTSGSIHRMGQVSGLLELGSGFHPEMTGRENILTAGILNGLTKRDVLAQRDEIISFSELEAFIDQPVRTYSSGMFLRLAFATAIHFNPDLLLIDEVLAVGDSRFQQKCLEKLNAFQGAGKTLVLVSHNSEQIRSLCDEVLVLEEGRVVTQADPESAVLCYNDLMRQRTERRAALFSRKGQLDLPVDGGSRLGTQEATVRAVHLLDERGEGIDTIRSGEGLKVVLDYSLEKALPDMVVILGIYSETNTRCFETSILSVSATFGSLAEEGKFTCFLPRLFLLPGRYYIVVGLYPTDWSYTYDYHWRMHLFNIVSQQEMPPGITGFLSVNPAWSMEQGTGGIASK